VSSRLMRMTRGCEEVLFCRRWAIVYYGNMERAASVGVTPLSFLPGLMKPRR
jgi:hypothetical protein